MTEANKTAKCPRCGESALGRFCGSCGASLSAQPCPACGETITAGSRFCHHCGTGVGPKAGGGGIPPAWAIAASVLVVLAAFVAGQQFAAEPSSPADGALSEAPFAGGATRAPDISNMTPEEAANRLFDRVMRYASEGKPDSAAMFAPMAILAYERIGPLDGHSRFDIGTISAVVGDVNAAAAQADTVLKSQPNHLLALMLAMRAAELRNDAAGVARFRSRFVAAQRSERAKALQEYSDHQREIEEALKKAGEKP